MESEYCNESGWRYDYVHSSRFTNYYNQQIVVCSDSLSYQMHGAGMIYSFTEAILCMYFKSWNRLGFRTISFSCTYCVPLLRWHSHHRNILLRDDIPINPCTWSNRYPLKDFILNTYLNQNTQHLIYRNIHM